MPHPRVFVYGLGYVGARLARAALDKDWTVLGTTRDSVRAQALAAEGIAAEALPDGESVPEEALRGVTHLLATAPPGPSGDPALAALPLDVAADLRWVGYLSATSVYGDAGGGWVDAASTPAAPDTNRGRARLAAEEAWRATGLPLHVFRIAGIYGPGRSAVDQIRAGTARRIDKPGHVFSRIHVDDIVAALIASMENPRPSAIYDLADDAPSPAREVVDYACELLDMEPPPLEPFETAPMSPMLREFYSASRRVRNAQLKAELDWRPKYPSYREGLRAQVFYRDTQ